MPTRPTPAELAPLLTYFDKFFPLLEAEKELVVASFERRQYRKQQPVLQAGAVCQQFNFVTKGCLRIYKVDAAGNPHILQFAIENWWITDLNSFHGGTASELTIDALEDTDVLQITHAKLLNLYRQAPRFDRIFRVLTENAYFVLQRRLLATISSTAEVRLQQFTATYPFLLNRLSQLQIAAYLGITPEFLSRLRKRQARAAPALTARQP